ncbi:MAG: XRE family transcriptional regulator [Comamonadaceae bacterium]|nr:MAG: XRE family transcriptional regulator [Comamonadaceae bacterium]
MIFGAVLRRYRAAAGLSQEELAFRAGVDRTFVSRLERGTRQPTITTLLGLGAALGVAAAALMKDVEDEYLTKRDARQD